MSELLYRSLSGVGRWDHAIKQVGAQIRPYREYLKTAIEAAKSQKPVIAWRSATAEEGEEFQARLEERWSRRRRRARSARKRRDRRVGEAPDGVWVVLEPPPWSPDEPDTTFDAFFEESTYFSDPRCKRDHKVFRQDFDREGRALLLDSVPDNEATNPDLGTDALESQLLWLRPNTYTLERRRDAVQELEGRPTPRLAPLIRLMTKSFEWSDVERVSLREEQWHFLRHDQAGRLRDGTTEQRQFVSIALGTEDFALLEGPPGSGKTTAICELVAQMLKQRKRVLLVASTHVAVDNVLERLISWQDELEDAEKPVLPVRIGQEDRVSSELVVPFTLGRLKQTWQDELRDFLDGPTGVKSEGEAARAMLKSALSESDGGGDKALARLILDSSNLVCGTTIGILQHPEIKRGDAPQPFDMMILDEASKTTFAEFLVPALHARRWVVVGDIRQLSPYIEGDDLAENLGKLVPEPSKSLAVHAALAALRGRSRQSSAITVHGRDLPIARAELADRAEAALLDDLSPVELRGQSDAVPALLHADLIAGTSEEFRRLEERLPADIDCVIGDVSGLRSWEAARRARRKTSADLQDAETPSWEKEVAWRLVRSYELRQNKDERKRYEAELESLLPRSLDWNPRFEKSRKDREEGRPALEILRGRLENLRRVTMPSILELLQKGFERLPGWTDNVTLNDGLPDRVLGQRLVSLSFQHRMHPHISAFPRDQFYSDGPPDSDSKFVDPTPAIDHRSVGDWFHRSLIDLFGISNPLQPRTEPPARHNLLQDSREMSETRDWGYKRYARRAQWLAVSPRRPMSGPKNSNIAEVEKVLAELEAFVSWASANPKPGTGEGSAWEVAILTFYRGQEGMLRDRLKKKTRQFGNSRSFRFQGGSGSTAVKVTLCTVDRFQGHEADFVILSFVKSGSVGFLNSPNRLNVALTRARYQLVLVGDRNFFRSDRCRSPLLQALASTEHYDGDIAWETTS